MAMEYKDGVLGPLTIDTIARHLCGGNESPDPEAFKRGWEAQREGREYGSVRGLYASSGYVARERYLKYGVPGSVSGPPKVAKSPRWWKRYMRLAK